MKNLKIFIRPNCFSGYRRTRVKHWLGWYTRTLGKSKSWNYEIVINSKRFFPFQIITFIHELGHYLIDKYRLWVKIHGITLILERISLPIAFPEKYRGVYFIELL